MDKVLSWSCVIRVFRKGINLSGLVSPFINWTLGLKKFMCYRNWFLCSGIWMTKVLSRNLQNWGDSLQIVSGPDLSPSGTGQHSCVCRKSHGWSLHLFVHYSLVEFQMMTGRSS